MKFSALKKYLENKPLRVLYCLEGSDAYFIEKAREMIVNCYVTGLKELNVTYLVSPAFSQIEESFSVLPFGSEGRALCVSEFYPTAAEEKKLFGLKYGGCVLIIANRQKSRLSAREEFFIDCDKESPQVLAGWIAALFKGYNKRIGLSEAETLARYCGQDMTRITNEIKKLSALEQEIISARDIEQNVAKEVEYQAYMLAQAVIDGDGRAYDILKDFSAKGAADSHLLSALYSNFRRMYYAKTSRLGKEGLAKALKIKPYAVTMSQKAAKSYRLNRLQDALKLLAEAEYDIKRGGMGEALYYVMGNLIKNENRN